ncbi:hypothetical protein [Paraburkholderia domus]|jgi:hypothetical protein|uniref:Transmembrane protein n=1 Tax=Paraburkholderia domus TaxID=2793075 RepID=A0A9N8MVU8_9BURK|nr:hypothetical protein [Paraburkholderia domus]MBK5049346.1 hypothetical protein [Burkholderia sp. R-70006]MBK5062091.1 hypothetical protein [Burkholderia sp. R-70199]MBK5124270.1 hypothetical protein [Burkholderia sp. R-69980]MBK5166932.1 hypothetical protein [Burkholderia sp. R-70211]CAE6730070.1 hypothetical protein R75483_02157 [Paraburkholderia domus]
MNTSNWIRRFHRWVSIAFTLTVIANFVTMARGIGLPPPWITYAPLLPLALLLFTGLYMFVLPYVSRQQTGDRPQRSLGDQEAPLA